MKQNKSYEVKVEVVLLVPRTTDADTAKGLAVDRIRTALLQQGLESLSTVKAKSARIPPPWPKCAAKAEDTGWRPAK
jgi:hypothetical protein